MAAERVFIDVSNIPPGQDFVAIIDRTVEQCGKMLVIIGPRWANILAERRSAEATDYVAHEISTALRLNKIVIPVLVGGASTAELAELPPGLAALAERQAIEIRDGSFKQDCERLVFGARKRRRFVPLVAAMVAAIAICLLLWLGVAPDMRAKTRANEIAATARVEMREHDYQRAFNTYGEALRLSPNSKGLQDEQLQAAMRWAEHFSVIAREDEKAEDIAMPLLAKLIDVLETGVVRAKAGTAQGAGILAHAGWAHWLNQHIAFKEFTSTAEDDLRRALTWDPKNVYANAMLGNIIFQKHGSADEALQHFGISEQSGQERALVRAMELGAMHYDDDPQVEAAMLRVANQMRKNAEPLDGYYLSDLLSKFDVHDWGRMQNTARALSSDEAWQTYQWLAAAQKAFASDPLRSAMQAEFVHACILEANGTHEEALSRFQDVQKKSRTKEAGGFLSVESAHAIARVQKH